jgi:hypothetical protein
VPCHEQNSPGNLNNCLCFDHLMPSCSANRTGIQRRQGMTSEFVTTSNEVFLVWNRVLSTTL